MNLKEANLFIKSLRQDPPRVETRVGDPPPDPGEPPPPAKLPPPAKPRAHRRILPFFPILRYGSAAPGLEGDEYRHSADYARNVYIAILINWVVDVIGLGYLFYTFVSMRSAWVKLALPAILAIGLSSGFAVFAISLVRKPLRKPRNVLQHRRLIQLCTGVIVLAVMLLVAAPVLADPTGGLAATVRIALVGLTAAIIALLTIGFGLTDALYVTTRGIVMIVVGAQVAQPLHEAMFQKEIEQSYYDRRIAELEALLDGDRADGQAKVNARYQACMEDTTPVELEDCTEHDRKRRIAEYTVQAWDLLKAEESDGPGAQQETRDYLLARAKNDGATETLLVLGRKPTGIAGKGRWFEEYQQESAAARLAEKEAREDLKDCQGRHSAATNENKKQEERCANQAKQLDEVEESRETIAAGRAAELEAITRRYAARPPVPGAIDRGLEFNRLINDIGVSSARAAETRAQPIGAASGTRAVVLAKQSAAWVFALIMPLIVITMKLTGGERLEPYLQRRWTSG